jgi:hypothetical protein
VLTSWNHFYERLNGGRSDELVLGDMNLTYNFGCGPRGTVRAGLGARVLADHGRSDWGVNFHLGADLFPARPWICTIGGDVGTVGDATVLHGRLTLGVVHRGWELFGGYDVMTIEDTTLHGPLVGVRVWF